MSLCPACNFFCFDIGLPYLAHGSITMRECVAFIIQIWWHVDLWPQGQLYRVFDMALCLGHSFFVYWYSHTISGTWVFHHRIMCHIHSWTLYDLDLWPQYQHYIFTMNLSMGKIIFALWHRHTKFGTWDNMFCTFMTCVWPWPLTYMWWWGYP